MRMSRPRRLGNDNPRMLPGDGQVVDGVDAPIAAESGSLLRVEDRDQATVESSVPSTEVRREVADAQLHVPRRIGHDPIKDRYRCASFHYYKIPLTEAL